MKKDKLIALLRQIEALVAECLRVAGEGSSAPDAKQERSRSESSANGALTDRIIELRDKRFFQQSKAAREVQAKLNPTYHCELNRVSMALLRLNDRKKLRKASKIVDKKKQVAYVW